MIPPPFDAVTVTLNPAIDQTVTIANFTAGAVNRVEAIRSNSGGKGVNVASNLADAGQRVAVSGFLGQENDAAFTGLFARKMIADHFIRVAGQTRVGIKVVDPVLGQTTDINFPGTGVSNSELETLARTLATLEARCFVLAGSLPPGTDPGIYRQLTTALRYQERRVVLDASGEALRLALDARPHLIKPNLHELEELVGQSLSRVEDVVDAARQLVGRGIEQVTISMGRDGACFVTAQEAVIARPPDVEVRSTVGAGDAMVAGLVAAHARKLPLAESARLATAFSVHALTRTSRTPDFHTSIEALLPQIQIQSLK